MDIKIKRGDSYPAVIADVTVNQIPYPLAGCTVWFTAKRKVSDLDNAATTIQKSSAGGAITFVADPTTGVLSRAIIQLLAADTASLPDKETRLPYDIQIKDPTGLILTVATGDLIVSPDITRAA